MVGNCVSNLLSQFISNCRLLLPSNSSSSISAMADEMLQPAAPVSYPLKTLEELRDRFYFASFHSHFNKSRVPLLHAGSRPPNSQEGGGEHRPRLLVCHDMKGGYQDDRWVQGSPNGDAYSLWHWHLIDTFVYFSHSLVTLPPPCWTNTAHRHGVQVLGTFITEWDEGKALCKNLLASKESTQLYASRLAELAAVLGFDGWLINIENEVEKQHLANLLEFVRLLTMYMHQMVPGSTVIWYDSVTKDGKLRWQNCLNDLNKCYFDLCDGIFTNYTWKKDDPVKSAVKAGDRRCDVYMGVDVFGRNTFGGGGFQSNVALKAARDAGVSAALFAPGWVYETDQGPTFPAAQNRWWGLVAECWPSAQRYPIQLPFFSNFDQGFGKELYLLGSKISRTPWSNISCQNLQPVLHIETQPKQGLFESIVSGEYPVYSGGACVKFSGSIEEQAFCMTVLYEADVATNMPLTVSYTVRHQTDSSLSVLLKVCDQKGAQYILLVDSEEESNEEIYSHQTSRICILCPSTAYQVQGSQGWSLREYSVEVTGKLEGIFAISYLHKLNAQRIFDLCKAISSADSSSVSCETTALESTAETVTYEAFLGHIAVSNTHEHNFCNGITFKYSKVCWEELPGQRVVSLMLTWVMEDSVDSQIVNYRIYVSKGVSGDDEFEHLGVAMVEDFYVSQLPVPEGCQALTFYLQMSCTCGFSTRLDKSPIIVIPVP